MRSTIVFLSSVLFVALGVFTACDNDGTEADRLGIGWACTDSSECPDVELGDGGSQQLECLTEFDSGYCGLSNCTASADCPDGSICVLEGAETFCFRRCNDKDECNLHRPSEAQSSCVSSFDWADDSDASSIGGKACIPNSSGV